MSILEQALDKPELFRRIIFSAFFFPLILSGGLIAFLVFYLRRRHRDELERKDLMLKQQSLIIEKQQAVERERNRIATEMHDDLGSGLTRIRFLSARAMKHAQSPSETEQIKRISEQSNQLVTNMSEIIWAMNSRFDTADSLSGYIRRYASEYLAEHQIPFQFHSDLADRQIQITAEKRRNVFLVIKETLHNTIKYSGAQGVEMHLQGSHEMLEITLVEKQARGFEPEQAKEQGNGIYNIRKRMEAISGEIIYQYEAPDMKIIIQVPVHE